MLKVNYLNRSLFWGKWAFTACLVILMVFMTGRNYRQATLKRLNYFMIRPDSQKYLVDVVMNRKEFNKASLRSFAFYFKMLTERMPQRADAHGMLGFVSYHLGKHRQAVSSYKRAVSLNPGFFWYYYNLGVIHFRKGDYDKAVEYLERSIKTGPQNSLAFILASKRIYLPLISEYSVQSGGTYDGLLRKGYMDANELLIQSHYYAKNYSGVLSVADYAGNSFPEYRNVMHYYKLLAAYKIKGMPGIMPVSEDFLEARDRTIQLSIF